MVEELTLEWRTMDLKNVSYVSRQGAGMSQGQTFGDILRQFCQLAGLNFGY